jgi:5'-3' exonuclease
VFCFDQPPLLRRTLCPGYKTSRETSQAEKPQEIQDAIAEMKRQTSRLRDLYLPGMGYLNIRSAPGYEADDHIAAWVEAMPREEDAVIVSSDGDMFQLLGPRVVIWNPNKNSVTTRDMFVARYGIEPSQWADAKAIAGCTTDDVPGVPGVGEKTACKFLAGQLKPGGKIYENIVSTTSTIWKPNLALVRLPYAGTPTPVAMQDQYEEYKWDRVVRKLGMDTLVGPWRAMPRREELVTRA